MNKNKFESNQGVNISLVSHCVVYVMKNKHVHSTEPLSETKSQRRWFFKNRRRICFNIWNKKYKIGNV